jgi:hypothetical protein
MKSKYVAEALSNPSKSLLYNFFTKMASQDSVLQEQFNELSIDGKEFF